LPLTPDSAFAPLRLHPGLLSRRASGTRAFGTRQVAQYQAVSNARLAIGNCNWRLAGPNGGKKEAAAGVVAPPANAGRGLKEGTLCPNWTRENGVPNLGQWHFVRTVALDAGNARRNTPARKGLTNNSLARTPVSNYDLRTFSCKRKENPCSAVQAPKQSAPPWYLL